jgi:uncharacterized membrane protein YbhN (UPF0104 family)
VPPEPRPGRQRLYRIIGLLVIALFAGLAAYEVDLGQVGASLAGAHPGWLALSALANVLSLAFHARRWGAVVAPPGGRVRFHDSFAAMVAGFAVGLVLPARAGDLVRAHLLARRTRLSTAETLASAALDYVIGAATLVPLLAALALVTPLPSWARDALLVFAAVAGAGAAAVFLLRPPRGARAGRGALGIIARLRAGLSAAHDPGALAASVGWGLLGWGAELLIAVLALLAVGLPPSLIAAGLAVVATTAANVIALSPGNAGPFELSVVLALAGLGVAREPALAFALLYHLVHLLPVGVLGGIALLREARRPGAAGDSRGPGTAVEEGTSTQP